MQNSSPSFPFICPHCHSRYNVFAESKPAFCPFCGQSNEIKSAAESSSSAEENPKAIGPYQLVDHIGKGGMGEVFLAYDTSCGRQIALKRIRPDLKEHPQIHRRFLKEARITCQLTHPAIIPIYTIHQNDEIYYTMPFVEGETLKQILRRTRQQERKGEKLDHIGGSIPALMRIYLAICQAVAYAHSHGVLHRDLKPENIIIGKYGEVLILDWGLAKFINSPEEDLVPLQAASPIHSEITRTGKVVGTISYMAPERAFSYPATIQTDIYSLGVILYQLLTLRPPFKRGTIEEFKKMVKHEKLINPMTAAPYRDIPRLLAQIAEKCLAVDPIQRYQSVDELIKDLESYMEGRSEWFHAAALDIKRKEDWEFQENVLIVEHVAITRITDEAEWVSLMVSHSSFAGNTKIEAEICLGENSYGVGFLLSIPEIAERHYINDGYCLWLGSDTNRSTKLLRSNVEVMIAPDIFLKRHQWYKIRIEKVERTIHVYINDLLQFSYIAHLPLIGTHIGLLSRDADFQIKPIDVYVGSLNIMVNCLAVPDAFLAHRDFYQALSEYRRIAYSFPDRVEGREALFRAGLTLIEQAKEQGNQKDLLDQALDQFEKLHGTPAAPLEYLGKSLVYQTLQDYEEEIKCFELAYRRYPKHPLLPVLQEQILSRMHELSRRERIATYQFIFLAVRHLPLTTDIHTRKLFTSLQRHWEHLPFIEENPAKDKHIQNVHFAIQLAFWLAKPYLLGEMIDHLAQDEQPMLTELSNALFCLIELGSWHYAQEKLTDLLSEPNLVNFNDWKWLTIAISCHQYPLENVFNRIFAEPLEHMAIGQIRSILYFLDLALDQRETQWVYKTLERLDLKDQLFDVRLWFDIRAIWAYLLDKDWRNAGELTYTYPLEVINQESTALHFLYGCWLQATEGKEMAHVHFTGILQVSYPRSWSLGTYYLTDELKSGSLWFQRAFMWEKRQLYRQLWLYYDCAGDKEKSSYFKSLYQEQFIYVEP